MNRHRPKILFVVNTRADEEGDVAGVLMTVRQAEVDADVAFSLSDLEVLAAREVYDAAAVDLSFPDVDACVAGVATAIVRPMVFASLQFWRSVDFNERPGWAGRHIVYSHASQFGEELKALGDLCANEVERDEA